MKKNTWLLLMALIIGLFGVFSTKVLGYDSIEVEDGTLYGKTEYAGKDTLVILVSGSGPTDMDGNTSLTLGRNDSLVQLAKALKKKGSSTLRYDKRTAGKSAQSITTEEMDFDLFVDDCEEIIRYGKEQGYKKIFIAGHSQGSLVAMLAAAKEKVDGVISLSGPGFPIDVTLERQITPQLGADSREITIIKGLRKGVIDNTVKEDDPLFSPKNQRFLLTWMEYDPVDAIRELDCPILIIQGSKDLQVDQSEFDKLTAASPKSKAILIEGMNHVLKPVKDQEENINTYTNPSYRVDGQLIEEIAVFVKDN